MVIEIELFESGANSSLDFCLIWTKSEVYKRNETNCILDPAARIKKREAQCRQATRHFRTGVVKHEGWNFNSGNYLFTTDTK